LTVAEWEALQQAWGGCAYCGTPNVPLQKDCVLPIAHGGRSTLANVVPACRSCNTSKCDSEITVWMRRQHLDEATFFTRRPAICSALGEYQAGMENSGESRSRAISSAKANRNAS
jgi:hypothetical protein